MKKNNIALPLKTPRDKITKNGYKNYSEWIPNIVSIVDEQCAKYMEKLQWLNENPRSEFRIDNGHGEADVNHWYRPTNKARIENGENPNND